MQNNCSTNAYNCQQKGGGIKAIYLKKVFIANVTFEPCCRNNRHIQRASGGGDQLLLCTDGKGRYCEGGKAPQNPKPGDAVTVPANVKHRHGAKSDSRFSHLAVEVPGESTSTEWLEPVDDAHYPV